MTERTAGRRLPIAAALAWGTFALHLLASAYLVAPVLLEGRPPWWGDHTRNFTTLRFELECARVTGRPYGYVPNVVAGFPHHAAHTNSHAARATVHGLTRSSLLSAERAFGLWILGALVATPLLVGLAARKVGASPAAGIGLTVMVLHLDPLVRPLQRYGMVAWLLASALLVAFMVTFAGALEPRARRWHLLALLAALSAHALLPLTLAVSFGIWVVALLVWPPASGRRRLIAAALVAGAVGLVLNAWWIVPLLRDLPLKGATASNLNVPPSQLGSDLLAAIVPGRGYLGGSTALRWCLLGLGSAGAMTLLRDPQRRPLGLAGLALLVPSLTVAYLGGGWQPTQELQSHRFLTVAVLGSLPFAPAGARAALDAIAGRPSRRIAAALGCVAVGVAVAVEAVEAARPPLRRAALDEHGRQVLDLLRDRADRRARVLIETPLRDPLPTIAATELDAPALSIRHADWVDPYGEVAWLSVPPRFLGLSYRELRREAVAERLHAYNVGWVVASTPFGKALMDASPAETFAERLDVGPYRVLRVAEPPGWFLEGVGRVRARPGRLELSELTGPVTVRFHYVPGLRALEPGVRVERAPAAGDPVGFVRVRPGISDRATLEWSP